MNSIKLTSSMRSNLLSLKDTSSLQALTQNRLSTGNKVNSAIDNPSSYYVACSLNNRAGDLNNLLDSMGQAISTIKTATDAIDTGLAMLDQAASITEQALSETKMVPMPDPVKLVDNVEELRAKGYTVVSSATSLNDFKALLQTDNAKIVLAEDVTFGSSLNITGNNVTINGGGHQLKCNGIVVEGTNASISNVEVAGCYATTLVKATATATGLVISNARLKNEYAGYQTGLSTYADITIENVAIDIANMGNTRVMGIIARNGSNTQISNLHFNLNSKYDGVSMGILAQTGSTTTIDGMSMTSESENAYAIIKEGGTINGVTFLTETKGKVDYPASWFDGEANTQAILSELGDGALAAKACNEYSVGTEAEFGAGTWYLPAMGELMEMYGYNYDNITDVFANSGATHSGRNAINSTLEALASKGVDAEKMSGYLWSSSESDYDYSWTLRSDSGHRNSHAKPYECWVRCFNQVEISGSDMPEIGDVYYTDNTWGKASAYDASKTIAGVVASVGNEGSVKIMSLKNIANIRWSTTYTDVKGVEDLDFYQFQAQVRPSSTITAEEMNKAFATLSSESHQERYNEVMGQYDALVQDALYKGVNLLQEDSLKISFNETGGSELEIKGKDVRSQSLGINSADWKTYEDIANSINELRNAINSLRNYTTELGNNYSIVQTREDFTESLINILSEGADKLTLADMNEESANMLALQTRQQLATNALSLVSQSEQAILKLF